MTEDAPLPPLHPGEVLREEFMAPLGLDAEALARACGAERAAVAAIADERAGISGDIAIRFGRVFDTSPEFWMNLQQRFDLESAALALGTPWTGSSRWSGRPDGRQGGRRPSG